SWGGMAERTLLPGVLRIIAAGTVLGIICWQTRELFFNDFTSWSFFARFSALAVGGVLTGGIYLFAAFIFRVPELQMFASRFLRRKK
ncbi:MAG: hypothetical protein IJ985_05450, partial [Akkermansia sp.]|nr:hypothetical protein [Akkermansia sp.]